MIVADGVSSTHDADAAPSSRRGRVIRHVAEGLHAGGRALVRALPRTVVRAVEDRVFYAIFQKTRVENDAYGWRPPPPGA